MQELSPRKILTLASVPAASSAYEGVMIRVGSKLHFCDGTTWFVIGLDAKWKLLGTFAAVAGNTSLDMTGLPADVQEIYVSIDGISTLAGTNMPLLQFITSGGVDSTGYVSRAQTNTSISEQTTGMAMFWTSMTAAEAIHGDVHIFCVDPVTHYYKCSGLLTTAVRNVNTVGYVTLDSVLTGLRYLIPSSVFDAGSITVWYREG